MINVYFASGKVGWETGICDQVHMSNILLHSLDAGIYVFSGKISLEKAIIYNIMERGINTQNSADSELSQSGFKNTQTAVSVNPEITNTHSGLTLMYNDFIKNQTHIQNGILAAITAKNNNFLAFTNYAVEAGATSFQDTLDFKQNYWQSNKTNEIASMIYDKTDMDPVIGRPPVVYFEPFSEIYLNWLPL